MKDDDDALLVQVLDCYAGDRVVEFEFPRTLCLSTDDTVLDMKRRSYSTHQMKMKLCVV